MPVFKKSITQKQFLDNIKEYENEYCFMFKVGEVKVLEKRFCKGCLTDVSIETHCPKCQTPALSQNTFSEEEMGEIAEKASHETL